MLMYVFLVGSGEYAFRGRASGAGYGDGVAASRQGLFSIEETEEPERYLVAVSYFCVVSYID